MLLEHGGLVVCITVRSLQVGLLHRGLVPAEGAVRFLSEEKERKAPGRERVCVR